jgi:hypothetical protein
MRGDVGVRRSRRAFTSEGPTIPTPLYCDNPVILNLQRSYFHPSPLLRCQQLSSIRLYCSVPQPPCHSLEQVCGFWARARHKVSAPRSDDESQRKRTQMSLRRTQGAPFRSYGTVQLVRRRCISGASSIKDLLTTLTHVSGKTG